MSAKHPEIPSFRKPIYRGPQEELVPRVPKRFPCIKLLIFPIFFLELFLMGIQAATLNYSGTLHPTVNISDTLPDHSLDSGPVSLFVDEGRDGLTEGDAIRAYVPIESEAGTNYNDFSGRVLPDITDDTDVSGILHFRFHIDLEASSEIHYLHLAMKRNGLNDYRVLTERTLNPAILGNTVDFNFQVPFDTLCSSPELSCSSLQQDSSPDTLTSTILLFFLSDTMENSTIIPESDYSNKLFYNIFLSNKIEPGTAYEISLLNLYKGDETLYSVYEGQSSLNYLDSLYAYSIEQPGLPCPPNDTSDSYAAVQASNGLEIDLKTREFEGEVRIRGLQNNRCHTIRVYQKDKFGFTSRLSNSRSAAPESILTLLEKESCFLLTAGFGREHRIIKFFQHLRDQYLKHSSLGRSFIKFYYTYSPSLTPYVFKSSLLSLGIRSAAYTLYAFLRYWYGLLFFLSLVLLSFPIFINLKRSLSVHPRKNNGRP